MSPHLRLAFAGIVALAAATAARATPPAIPAQSQDLHGIHLLSWTEVDPDGSGSQPANARLLDAVERHLQFSKPATA